MTPLGIMQSSDIKSMQGKSCPTLKRPKKLAPIEIGVLMANKSFRDSPALYFERATWFELILCPANLLKLFISCRSSLVGFLWSLKHIISSANSDISTFSLPFYIPLIYFCCLIASAKTSSTLLSTHGESGHSCLFPDFSEIVSNISPFSLVLSVGWLILILLSSGRGLVFLISILFTWSGVIYCQVVASLREVAAKLCDTWGLRVCEGQLGWCGGWRHPFGEWG